MGLDLAQILEAHQGEIAAAWAEMVQRLPHSHYRERPFEELRASTTQALGAIIEALTTGSYAALETYLTNVSLTRLHMGFDIAEVIEALLLCKDAALPVIWKAYPSGSPEARGAMVQLDDCLRRMIGRFGYLYAEAMNRSLQEQQQRAAALAMENARLYDETRRRLAESQSLQRVTAALLQKISLEEVLKIVCTEAQRLIGAVGSSVFLLEDGEWLRVALAAGAAPPTFGRMPIEGSLTGMAVRRGEPVVSNDPEKDERGYHGDFEPAALLAVPLCAKEVAIGALVAVNKPGGFTQEDVRITNLFADQAAMAIENARLYEQGQELAAVRERQRLARDLHDAVTQTLFSASLIAEVLPRLWDRNPDEGRRRLEELRQLTRGALAEMRTLLLELRPAALTEASLGDLLRQLAEATTGRARVPVSLTVESQCPLPPDVQVALYRIAQEALNLE